jgi:hypothetical protein
MPYRIKERFFVHVLAWCATVCSVLLCACNVLIREIASSVSHFPALEARAFSLLSLTRSLACVYAYPSEYYLHPLARCGTSDDDGMGARSLALVACTAKELPRLYTKQPQVISNISKSKSICIRQLHEEQSATSAPSLRSRQLHRSLAAIFVFGYRSNKEVWPIMNRDMVF